MRQEPLDAERATAVCLYPIAPNHPTQIGVACGDQHVDNEAIGLTGDTCECTFEGMNNWARFSVIGFVARSLPRPAITNRRPKLLLG